MGLKIDDNIKLLHKYMFMVAKWHIEKWGI